MGGSISHHSSNNLTWLQRQQQKLRDRREVQLRAERLPHETRLLSELRGVQTTHRYRPSPSQRLDGYTSDTTLFADEDEEDFTVPLHINTTTSSKVTNGSSAPVSPLLPHRTSSRRNYSTSASQFNTISNSTVGRQKSNSFDRERPFVAVKRSLEQNRKYSDSTVIFSLFYSLLQCTNTMIVLFNVTKFNVCQKKFNQLLLGMHVKHTIQNNSSQINNISWSVGSVTYQST